MHTNIRIALKLNFMSALFCYTALRNHCAIVHYEMSSWTALTWYMGMKAAFKTKYMKSKYFRPSILKI